MFGVLAAEDAQGRLGYFSAFSGILAGSNRHPFFVPPVYDLLQPHGFFKTEEQQISLLNTEIQAIASSPAYLQDCRELASTESEAQQTLLQAKQAMKTAKEERDPGNAPPLYKTATGNLDSGRASTKRLLTNGCKRTLARKNSPMPTKSGITPERHNPAERGTEKEGRQLFNSNCSNSSLC